MFLHGVISLAVAAACRCFVAPGDDAARQFPPPPRHHPAEALIVSVYLAGTNTRRVKRALCGLFEGAVSKDVVSRAWRKVKTDWEARVAGAASPTRTSSG